MCRPLLDRSFNRDIAGPENTDSFEILKQKFLIANMTIPENTVTTSGLVVEGCAGRFLQARAFAVLQTSLDAMLQIRALAVRELVVRAFPRPGCKKGCY